VDIGISSSACLFSTWVAPNPAYSHECGCL
jgi:hypothetical protein